jgi:hypothetical protein
LSKINDFLTQNQIYPSRMLPSDPTSEHMGPCDILTLDRKSTRLCALIPPGLSFKVGETFDISIDPKHVHLWPA